MSGNLAAFLQESKRNLLESLRIEGIMKSRSIEEALLSVPREAFLFPDTSSAMAYQDEPIPLGNSGQTISAPHMVVMMLEELELHPGLKVLEVGGGSGYNAALIGSIVSKGIAQRIPEPLVTSIERDENLTEFARKNLEKVGLSKIVRIISGDGSLGYPKESEEEVYDRIIITAGAPRVPRFLKSQLKKDGILLAPVGGRTYQKLMKLRKLENRSGKIEFQETHAVDCMFVPLIGADAHQR
ncbi:MAG: protein-L-isoaspartate(D-aspartate) O-methyltransferase [Thaumarchaeota archaeon]|nr:protein-L-isoaspartate(D-aspartate) O-methyltransferase [Nitrososphaerota archaeon]